MHHLHARHEVHSPIYNEWLDIKAPYVGPKAKDVTMHALKLIWASLYDPKYYEVSNMVANSPMSLENVA